MNSRHILPMLLVVPLFVCGLTSSASADSTSSSNWGFSIGSDGNSIYYGQERSRSNSTYVDYDDDDRSYRRRSDEYYDRGRRHHRPPDFRHDRPHRPDPDFRRHERPHRPDFRGHERSRGSDGFYGHRRSHDDSRLHGGERARHGGRDYRGHSEARQDHRGHNRGQQRSDMRRRHQD